MTGRLLRLNHEFTIKPLGEAGVLVNFGSTISPEIHCKVKALADYLETHPFAGMIEYVISYTSLAVYYNPFVVKKHAGKYKSDSALEITAAYIRSCMEQLDDVRKETARVVQIPVCYGGEYGPDIDYVAQYNHLSVEEVIAIHTEPEYLVYMIGFCPGFPYLGGMDKRIATPRRDTPRVAIPACSIGIAGEQTGGYPLSTPGGWQIIGRTPMDMFSLKKEDDPSLLHAGDIVKFYAVSEEEFAALKEEYGHES